MIKKLEDFEELYRCINQSKFERCEKCDGFGRYELSECPYYKSNYQKKNE